jgi:hypothetical protein
MHIQKTSSWFGNFLLVWSCADYLRQHLHDMKTSSINEHLSGYNSLYEYSMHVDKHFQSLGVGDSTMGMLIRSAVMSCSVNFAYTSCQGVHVPYKHSHMNHTIVTLLRKPTCRLISAFLYGIMLPMGFSKVIKSDEFDIVKHKIRNATSPIYAYATLPGIASCQTKMLLGHECGSNPSLTPADGQEAIRRLHEDTYFFGLTEEPEASVNLFLAMHSEDGTKPYRKTMTDMVDPPFKFTRKRMNDGHNYQTHQQLVYQLDSNGWKDEYDEVLYQEASEAFYRRCQQYKIPTRFASIDELMAYPH